MLSETERWIKFYRIGLRWSTDEAQRRIRPPTMEWALQCMRATVDANAAVRMTNNETTATRLAAIRMQEGFAILLFQYTDTNISDPVFGDLQAGTLRTEPKLQGEGISVTAHVVVRMTPLLEDEYPVPYIAAIEEVPGLNRTVIANFLGPELHDHTAFEFEGEDGRQKRTYVQPVFDQIADEKLGDALESSYLAGIELVETNIEPSASPDEPATVIPVTRSMKLRVAGRPHGAEARRIIADVKGRQWEHAYNIVKVTYRKSEGRQKTVDVPVRVADAAEVLAGRAVRLTDFDDAMPQAVEEIRTDLVRKMVDALTSGVEE